MFRAYKSEVMCIQRENLLNLFITDDVTNILKQKSSIIQFVSMKL